MRYMHTVHNDTVHIKKIIPLVAKENFGIVGLKYMLTADV